MPELNQTSSASNYTKLPTAYTNDDQSATARHESAAQTGAAAAKAADFAADAGEATSQKAADLGNAASKTASDAYESTKDGAKKAADTAKATGQDIADKSKATLDKAGTKVKQGYDQAATSAKKAGKTAIDATTAAGQRVNAEAKGAAQSVGNAWSRGTSAGVGERPITFLGFNSVPLATAGALLGLGLGIAGLFAAVTIYVPVSWILLGAGAVSLVDLVSSLIYRSREKGRDASARPLTALNDKSGSNVKTTEDRLARVQSDCEALIDDSEAQKRAIDNESRVLKTKHAKVTSELEAHKQTLIDLDAKREAIIEKQNSTVTEIPESIRRAVAEVDAQRKGVKEKKEAMLALAEEYKASLALTAKKHSEVTAHLKSVDEATRKLSENVAQADSLHKTLARLDQTTDTHTSGTTVKLETSTSHKGKSRQSAA